MIFDMQKNVNHIVKVKKEIDRAIKKEKNICLLEDSFDSEIIKRLSFENLYNLDSENEFKNEEMEYI